MADAPTLRLDFSEEEAQSEGRSWEAVPNGWYPCYIIDGELAEIGPNAKNAGKPMWKLTLNVVEDHKYANRRFWSNVMLFPGALYTLAQLMKALDFDISAGEVDVPPLDEVVGTGEVVDVSVAKVQDKYAMEKSGTDEIIWKNEVKGFRVHKSGASSTSTSSGSSLLP